MFKKILRLAFEKIRAVSRFFTFVFLLMLEFWKDTMALLKGLFGKFSYQKPVWIGLIFQLVSYLVLLVYDTARRWIVGNPKRARQVGAGVLVTLLLASGWYWWYQQQPKPIVASFTISNPERTRIEDPKALPDPVTVMFNRSVAPIDRIGKEISTGIEISPKVEGGWRWVDDQRLRFTPRADWPVGVKYDVTFSRELIAGHIALDEYSGRFQTAAFNAHVSDVQFYQDPVEASAKKVVATITFTHPVDTADFEKHIKLRQAGKGSE